MPATTQELRNLMAGNRGGGSPHPTPGPQTRTYVAPPPGSGAPNLGPPPPVKRHRV